MTKKRANKEDKHRHQLKEAVPVRQILQLPPLTIQYNQPLNRRYEATRSNQRERGFQNADFKTINHSKIGKMPAADMKLHDVAFQRSNPKDEVKALRKPQEASGKAGTTTGTDFNKNLPARHSPHATRSKYVHVILIMFLSLPIVGGLSFVGLLRYPEMVGPSNLFVPYGRELECGLVQASKNERTFSIKNTGDVAVILGFFTQNWDPPKASGYLEISWDYDGRPVYPGYTVEVTFTIIDKSITGIENFTFDILFISTVA